MSQISDKELLEELKTRFTENKKSLQQLKQMANQLRIVNNKLKQSETMKTNFLSNIRNEIVNPFASIMALSKNILGMKKLDENKVRNMVQLIHSEAFILDFQLRNIFTAAELEAGEVFPELFRVDLLQLVNNVLEIFGPEVEKRQLRIEIKCNWELDESGKFLVVSDSDKFQAILGNLLSNAIKFSHVGAKIELQLNSEPEVAYIKVVDFGMGISKENQEIIFDRFSRVDTGINSINRGHGLGLSICKSLIDMLDGDILMESKVNEGSKFTIVLPIKDDIGSTGMSSDGNEFLFDDIDLGLDSDNELF